MNKTWFLAFFLSSWAVLASTQPEQFPVIGVYTQQTDNDEPTQLQTANLTYFSASYVKFIEMAGAQVVPLLAYQDKAYYDDILPKINGVLFPGGGYDINIANRWTRNADYILKYSISEYERGRMFPVWGTCLGHQLLIYLTSGYDSRSIVGVRGQVKMTNTLKALPGNRLYTSLSPDTLYKLQNGQGLVYFNHHYATLTSYFNRSSSLQNFWKLESSTTSPSNQEFVSSVQAHKYPVYAVQYHPEKTLFEWKVFAQRSDAATEVIQSLANQLVETARKSPNRFSNQAEFQKTSIYNFQPHNTTMSFIQIYTFKEETKTDPWKTPNLQME